MTARPPEVRPADPRAPDPRRVAREREGRWAEHAAAAALILRGYRILARRHRTPYGELDLIARRGRRIAFVEVKYRRTREAAGAALEAIQSRRIYDAAEHWLSRYPALADYEQGFDVMLVMPWRWPVLLRDALQPVGYGGE
jgi:putative endonuclease